MAVLVPFALFSIRATSIFFQYLCAPSLLSHDTLIVSAVALSLARMRISEHLADVSKEALLALAVHAL